MKKIEKILFTILIISTVFLILLNTTNIFFKSDSVKDYSYTKAICNKTICRDYSINCTGKKLAGMSPTGFSIQNFEQKTQPENQSLCSK